MKQKYTFRPENMNFLSESLSFFSILLCLINLPKAMQKMMLLGDEAISGRKGEEMVLLNLEALRKGKEITEGRS